MEEHYIWLFNKSDGRGLWGAAICSLLLHVLMVVVMATTSIFYPTVGDASKLDVVWLYPSFLLGGEPETPSPPVQSSPEMTTPVSPAREVNGESVTIPAPSAPEPARKTALLSPPQAAEEEAEPPAIAPEPLSEEPDSEPEMIIPVPTPPEQTAKTPAKPHEPVVKKEPPPPPEKVAAVPMEDKPKSKPSVENRDLAKPEKPAPSPPPSAKVVPPRETPPQTPKPPAVVQHVLRRARDNGRQVQAIYRVWL